MNLVSEHFSRQFRTGHCLSFNYMFVFLYRPTFEPQTIDKF